MRHWLTRADMKLRQTTIKRFEPSHWTVDFPRGTMASVVSKPDANGLDVSACFGRKGDLVGLIYTSEDKGIHVGHRREEKRDYSRCTLRFRWQSSGVAALDAVDGPTLTIEGLNAAGENRTWYVRLWNYAEGSGTDARITLPFDLLRAGFQIDEKSELVDVRKIERLFISLVPADFVQGSDERYAMPLTGSVQLSEIDCSGSGSVLSINDAFVPEHDVRICTAYDDCYHLTPERVIDGLERLGYRDLINHYVGMSHYPALGGDGLVDTALPINEPARRWHESFAALAQARGFRVIWSLSMELLEQFCPEHWKQRSWDGTPARTGYVPPSTLLSPAVEEAFDYLGAVASAFVEIGTSAGLPALLQIGEPWWWINQDNSICLYDSAAALHWPTEHQPIDDVRSVTSEQANVLELAGALLSQGTARIVDAVEIRVGAVTSHLLVYLPSILRSDAPGVADANLPVGWQSPAFDVLQLEDYEWVTAGLRSTRRTALTAALSRLNYNAGDSHYLSGFVSSPDDTASWTDILAAVDDGRELGFGELLIWALPQVFRDSLTIFSGDDEVESFRDVSFPLDLGSHASVEPCFSTIVSTSAGGFEYRNVNWAQARLKFDVGPGVRSMEDLQTLLHFFRSMQGSAVSFRFRDSTDFSSAGMTGAPTDVDVVLGIGDGQKRSFALLKRYGTGEVRRITRPINDTVIVSVAGSPAAEWAVLEGGLIEFTDPPPIGAEVRAGFLFDVPARFEEDSLKISRKTFLAGEVTRVPLIEVREA